MEEPKRLRASVTLWLALFLAGQTQAAPFDEKLKAPRAATSQALRTEARGALRHIPAQAAGCGSGGLHSRSSRA